jgi:hypothetical protein
VSDRQDFAPSKLSGSEPLQSGIDHGSLLSMKYMLLDQL